MVLLKDVETDMKKTIEDASSILVQHIQVCIIGRLIAKTIKDAECRYFCFRLIGWFHPQHAE